MNSLPSMPSIEVLTSEHSQVNDYVSGNTVYTYVDGTVHETSEQIPYFTTSAPADNTLNTVITECFALDDAKEQNIEAQALEPKPKRPKRKPERKYPKKSNPLEETPYNRNLAFEGHTQKFAQGVKRERTQLKLPTERWRSRHTWGHPSPITLYDQNFGNGICPDSYACSSSSLYMRGRRSPRENSGVSVIRRKANNFAFLLEVNDFQSEELQVRVSMAGRILEVEARHEMKEDSFGLIERHFKRKYKLPDNALLEKTCSSHSEDGVLTIIIPRKMNQFGPDEVDDTIISADDHTLIDDYIPEKVPNNTSQRLAKLGERKANEQVLIDVPQFHADEVKVRVCGSELEVLARHEEREDDHGRIERSFRRLYNIPKTIQMDKNYSISSTLSEEGVLIVDMIKRGFCSKYS